MKSGEYKNHLKDTLENLIYILDDTYYSMKNELEDEILQRKEKIEKIDEETNRVYDLLTHKKCEKLIKASLPFRVRLFNKIIWGGHGIDGIGRIKIYFYFNNDRCHGFSYLFDVREIKELLKIKDGDL